MSFTYYSASAKFSARWYTTFGSSEQIVRDDNVNATEIRLEQRTLNPDKPVINIVDTGHSSQMYSRTDMVLVGRPYDSRGSSMGYGYYTTPQALPAAQAWWAEERKRLRDRSDRLYDSSPWL